VACGSFDARVVQRWEWSSDSWSTLYGRHISRLATGASGSAPAIDVEDDRTATPRRGAREWSLGAASRLAARGVLVGLGVIEAGQGVGRAWRSYERSHSGRAIALASSIRARWHHRIRTQWAALRWRLGHSTAACLQVKHLK